VDATGWDRRSAPDAARQPVSRYSAAVPDPEVNEPALGPSADPATPLNPPRRSRARSALPWVLGTAVILTLAVAGGLLTAYAVANLRAVPPPAALLTPTPTLPPIATPTPSATPSPIESLPQPRRTPTPPPTVTPQPTPFIHVVQQGESLTHIANLYGITVADILALNDIKHPNRIQPGMELLIPGWAPSHP
jgi:LysM repeat protein